ncbi:hypothetical protein [Maribacter sp. ACAM166]|uniref:hypothetical protein n=1 Tax=Maribacter sp. ACAM166 TaxID=2508996 RepID=UPI0010FDB3C2|nr:hypothetical protein [Maribacter sp. ACAM166]TLP80944.1 hypothetical protein ES765_05715 [Maribacter sp. ACAM166]
MIKKTLLIALAVLLYTTIQAQTKALQNLDFTVTSSCSYIAAPQGFQIHVLNGTNAAGSDRNHLVVETIRPKYYDNAIYGTNCSSNGNLIDTPCFKHIGTQNNNIGIFGTNSFAHDPDGNFILGDVYEIKNRTYGQNPYNGNGFFLEFSGHEALLCDDDFFYHIINKMNQYSPNGQSAIPSINGASRSFNNHAPLTGGVTTNGNGTIDDPIGHNWMNDNSFERLTTYLDANATGDWLNYLRVVESGYSLDFNTLHNAKIQQELTKKGYRETMKMIAKNNLGKYTIRDLAELSEYPRNNQESSTPVTVTVLGVASSLGSITTAGNNDAIQNNDATENIITLLNAPLRLGASPNTSNVVFPSSFFDKPKHQAFYLGNSVGASQYGPLTTYYKHDPLPSKCNPNNDDYIPAAFLNIHILDELILDWQYLTTKNFNALVGRGFDLEREYLHDFSLACGNSADTDDCFNQLMSINPDLKRLPVYPISIDQVSNNQSSVKNSKLKTIQNKKSNKIHIKKPPIAKEKPKPILIKTEAYYQDLIENKLFRMNPA